MGEGERRFGAIGQMTRYAMSVAGLDRRNTKNRVAAILGISAAVLLVGVITLDIVGVFTIPGMGLFYEVAGVEDPDAERAVERLEAKLSSSTLPEAERTALREKLLGARRRFEAEQALEEKTGGMRKKAKANVPEPDTIGIEETSSLSETERRTALDVFASDEKNETKLALAEPDQIQTPNLPDGLTRKAISKVVSSNSRSVSLCIAQASRKGEMLEGRMEISITIAANGRVTEAAVETPQFRSSVIGRCATRRIRGWKFPRFNGEPVTVIYPYIVGQSY